MSRPRYDLAPKRQRMTVGLYTAGSPVGDIAWFLEVAKTTVWRYLRGVPRLGYARRVPVIIPGRPPYWELHTRNGANAIVLGRKFCSGCGHWRHVCDFPHETNREVPRARCITCTNLTKRYESRNWSPEQLALHREYQRMYREGQRRAAGKSVNGNRHTVIDEIEWAFLPSAPMGAILDDLSDESLMKLCERAGIGDRALRRYIKGTSEHIRLDIADKLAVALGRTLYEIYGDTPVVHSVSTLDRDVRV